MNTPLSSRIRALLSKDGGFGMLEVLAVIVVVGLLAAIAIPKFSAYREDARVTAMESDLRSAGATVTAEQTDGGEYPSSIEGLVKTSPGVTISAAGGSAVADDLPASLSHLRLPGAGPSVQVPGGVTFTFAKSDAGSVTFHADCPASLRYAIGAPYCSTDADEVLRLGTVDAPAAMLLCKNTASGLVNAVSAPGFIPGDIFRPSKAPSGYKQGDPISFVAGEASCPSGSTAVGASFNGSSAAHPGRQFRLAWGLAEPLTGGGHAGGGGTYCLEASHAKTDKVRSWTPDGGMKKSAC